MTATATTHGPAVAHDEAALDRLVSAVVATAMGTMRTRRAARALDGDPDADASERTIVALCDGERLGDHACPAGGTLRVVRGRAVLDVGGTRTLLPEGARVTTPSASHHLEAVGDTAVLVSAPAAADARRRRNPWVS